MTKRRIEPYPAQEDFICCQDRFTGFVGGIGSGKTFAGVVKVLRTHGLLVKAGYKPLGLVVGATYPMLRDATLRGFLDIAADGVTQFHRSEMRAELQWGGEVLFRSADEPDRLRGANLHYVYIDEAALCPSSTWDIVIGRLRAEGTAGPCWVTTTPKGRNWLYHKQNMMTIFRAFTKDNPYLSPEFVTSLERAYTGDFARQELLGEFVTFEGVVYSEFSRDIHVVDTIPEGLSGWTCGVDEGYTNPSVMLMTGFDGDGRAYIMSEWYRRQVLQDEMLDDAWELHCQYHPFFRVDPSAAGLIAAMGAKGMTVEGARSEVVDGIRQVKARLQRAGDGKPRLFVHSSCVNTIAEFESYSWKKVRDTYMDQPEKIMDHAMDSLRYAISVPSGGPLSSVVQPTEKSRWSTWEEGSRWRT